MEIPLYSKAVLTRPVDKYEAGQVVIVTDYVDPVRPGQERGCAVEIGPWGKFGEPTDWTVVPESCLKALS
jgi:hypothetical protein